MPGPEFIPTETEHHEGLIGCALFVLLLTGGAAAAAFLATAQVGAAAAGGIAAFVVLMFNGTARRAVLYGLMCLLVLGVVLGVIALIATALMSSSS